MHGRAGVAVAVAVAVAAAAAAAAAQGAAAQDAETAETAADLEGGWTRPEQSGAVPSARSV